MKFKLLAAAFALFAAPFAAFAGITTDTVAVQGYDVVSYFQNGPVKGNGNNVAYHNEAAYLFSTAENKAAFEANPAKYLPAYGGYCAFGVTKNKKFLSDPLAWKVVDGTLYLNLSSDVQKLWKKDIPGNISTANSIWPTIVAEHPSNL